jgi:hypothetical protein
MLALSVVTSLRVTFCLAWLALAWLAIAIAARHCLARGSGRAVLRLLPVTTPRAKIIRVLCEIPRSSSFLTSVSK